MSGIRSKPLLGGAFGNGGRFSLASVPCIDRGLHSVKFAVMEVDAGRVLSVAEGKTEAIAAARHVIEGDIDTSLAPAEPVQLKLWDADELPPAEVIPRQVSRRRAEVFANSKGRCHYCLTPLTLDGTWHIEHMLPKALDGTDEAVNLVAACAPCNLKKRDRTAVEFFAQMANKD